MLTKYLHYLLSLAEYDHDESGYIVAKIPWYQWYYSQWENYEQARENLMDAVQWVIFHKLSMWDRTTLDQIRSFSSHDQLAYA